MTGRDPVEQQKPAWLRELASLLPATAQFLLSGNIHDLYPMPRDASTILLDPLGPAVAATLRERGVQVVIEFDLVGGIEMVSSAPDSDPLAESLVHGLSERRRESSLDALTMLMDRVAGTASEAAHPPAALLIGAASRLVRDAASLSEEEHAFFRRADRTARLAKTVRVSASRQLFNPIIWVLESERDLPTWFAVGNHNVRSIVIPPPDETTRAVAAERLLGGLSADGRTAPADQALFVQQTAGMTVRDMCRIVDIAGDQGLPAAKIDDAARCYRVGVVESPWQQNTLHKKLVDAESTLRTRVLGQDEAIRRSVDLLIRSATGLTGAHASAGTRPRGVLFFAGPTGVGKTELAKAITELVFSDERFCVRFDMSEFSAEHAADRLIGAPPGYMGHDAGGELTNAMRQQPFSLVLFDEIEKAHPRILDKFLQVLDDGRLSDGRGETVYFTESIIVFTSNLGIHTDVRDEAGHLQPNVEPGMPSEEMKARVTAAIRNYFTTTLNRPELLNRLGDNIVVFDFIAPAIAKLILEQKVENVRKQVFREHGIVLKLSAQASSTLANICLGDPERGGRGIGSHVESALVNPLSRTIFVRERTDASELIVDDLRREGDAWVIVQS